MDISKLKELHSQILELKKKAEATDSKRETRLIEREINTVELDFYDELYKLIDEIPDKIELRIKVDKVVSFETYDFTSWIENDLLERESLDNLNIIEELKIAIDEDFDPLYEIDNNDVSVEFKDDRYK